MTVESMRVALFVGCATAVLNPTDAVAAPPVPAEAAAANPDEILVTARRREESLQRVPVSISVATSEQLLARGVTDPTSLQSTTPGITFTQGSDGAQSANFNIRGVGQAFGGALPSVLTYFADVPLDPTGAGGFALFDLANVQVLRGPQGTLFGRNTTGGAVLQVPEAPGWSVAATGTATIGNYDARRFTGGITIPIVDQVLSVRVATDIYRRSGTSFNVFRNSELDNRHSDAFRASIRFEPTTGLRNDFVLNYLNADEHGVGYVLRDVRPNGAPVFPGNLPAGSAMDRALQQLYGNVSGSALYLAEQQRRGVRVTESEVDRQRREILLIANTTTFDLSDAITIKNIFGYERLKAGYSNDIDGTRQIVNYNYGSYPARTSLQGLTTCCDTPYTNLRQVSDEFQILGNLFDDRLKWVAGVFHLVSKTPTSGFVRTRESISYLNYAPIVGIDINGVAHGAQAAPVISNSRNSLQVRDETSAAYAQGTYNLSALVDGLSLTAGGRYTKDKRRAIQGTTNTTDGINYGCAAPFKPRNTPEDQCLAQLDAKFHGWGYTFTLEWQVTGSVLAYATTRRNYKAGGHNFLNSLDTSILTYKPEKATDYEVGLKAGWTLAGVRGRTNLSLYNADYSDMQRQVRANTGGAVSTIIFNAASATVRGLEAETNLRFGSHFDLNAFYTYTDAKYNKFVDPATGSDLSSNKLVGTPKHAGGATVTYTTPIGSLGTLAASGSFYAQSRSAYNADQLQSPNTFAPGYATYGARLGVNNVGGQPIDVALWARNLTDKDYIVAGLGLYGTTLGYNTVVYGEPRTYGIDITVRFGGK